MKETKTAAPQRRKRSDIRPKRRLEDLAFVELDGELVIYDERDDSVHHLNPTASILWQICDGTATERELAEEISEAFGLEELQVLRDIRTAVREMADARLMDVPKRRKRPAVKE